ncbi:hypothetical protein HW090_08235 [Pseudomonas sp. ABC1]|uniref:hypothetical protein n=1 Tax=Pseudomonas sp. ABC1 TaxID=2748080 RepID=UPI0015C33F7C|nr:hypothetical protein [Pseudomonas sp. ABC1]QLF93179.1 hypothetical protein HW090_08235 [Pseudomonas sp. ABC1]
MINKKQYAFILLPCLVFNSGSAFSSSDDAWDEFRRDVELKCLEASRAGTPSMNIKEIQVDPFGSDNFGFALVKFEDRNEPGTRFIACTYDKETNSAETSSPFHP